MSRVSYHDYEIIFEMRGRVAREDVFRDWLGKGGMGKYDGRYGVIVRFGDGWLMKARGMGDWLVRASWQRYRQMGS